jgi:Ca2+-binding EF-hand superfamily protein
VNQFKRVLDQILRGALNSDEIEQVGRKYDFKNNNQVNYREFCNVINKTFPQNNLSDNPENYVFKNPEYLGTLRSMKQLDDELESEIKHLLSRMSEYYSKKNIDVLTFFRDFDKNKNGLVSISQVSV